MDVDRTSASSAALISAFAYSPQMVLPRCAPSLYPRRGRCLGFEEAGRTSRLRDWRALTPRTPRSLFAGSGAARKAHGQRRLNPRASASPPGPDLVSPATLLCGVTQSQEEGHRRPLGPGHPRQRAGEPFLNAFYESRRSASLPFSRKSNSGDVVPYLPAQLSPLTFAL